LAPTRRRLAGCTASPRDTSRGSQNEGK
jgi:hypothetical protein